MAKKHVIFVVMSILMSFVLSACGGGSDAKAPAPPDFSLSSSKTTVLSNGSDSAQITATFATPVPDGTAVTFAVTGGTAALDRTVATTAGNQASVSVSSTTNGQVTVTATSASVTKQISINFASTAISLNASKSIALANNSDVITLTGTFSGTTPPDGTPVTFTITSGTATLGTSTVTTTAGSASTTLVSSVPGPVTVAVSTASANTTATSVKFITQPTSMDVSVAVNPPVTALETLQFELLNTAGATYVTNSAVGPSGAFVAAAQASNTAPTVVGLISTGFNTPATPVTHIIKLTYAITAGLPTVEVSPSGITATTAVPATGTPLALTRDNLVVSVKYNTDTF